MSGNPIYLTQQRSDFLTNWATINPVLRKGELAYILSTDTGRAYAYKVGDGSTAFNNLETFECLLAGRVPNMVNLSQSAYDELVSRGLVDPNTMYYVYEDEE